MITFKTIKENLSQIAAITEKDVKLSLRFKIPFIINLITPLITILLPLIIMGKFLKFNPQFGPWSIDNYMVYPFIGYNIMLTSRIVYIFPLQFNLEKYWKTLSLIIIAPFNRFYLLFGIFLSHLIIVSIPFTIFFILCIIYYPISFITALSIIGIYFLIAVIFSGLGLILGVFAVSKESFFGILSFMFTWVLWFSCISYPFEIFPELIQSIINLNPLYYIFDFLRLSWIENNIMFSITTHFYHFLILIILTIITPFLGVYIFNYVYKKYGIVGY